MTSRVGRRHLLKAGSIGILAGVVASDLRAALGARADAGTSPGTAKLLFILFAKTYALAVDEIVVIRR